MSDRLDEMTADWRPNHHEGWGQRWLTHMLGQVECSYGFHHEFRRPSCACEGDISDCCYSSRCRLCGAAL